VADKKLFAGSKIRRFRKGLGLTQVQMAEELGLSGSYLNLIERDQRPVSAQVLVLLAQTFDLDLRDLATGADDDVITSLREVAADPLLESYEIDRGELRELAERQPRIADMLVRLHTSYRETLADTAELLERASDGGVGGGPVGGLTIGSPVDEVRDVLHDRNNHFPSLEDAADRLSGELDLRDGEMFVGLKRRLADAHSVAVKIMPVDVMGGYLRRYDRHSRRVLVSEMLEPAARLFQVAFQLALFEAGDELDRLAAEPALSSVEAVRLFRIGLANYMAAAIVMPYERFLGEAVKTRYDIDVLARRFSASLEQVCHRLTTLRRPGARGVPFFMIRVDQAGNVSKRFGGRVFPFARAGGACPRWNLHDAFRRTGVWTPQLVELPEGARFFTIAHAIRRPSGGAGDPGQLLTIGLGCDAAHARDLIYSDGVNTGADAVAAPIGVNCRVCERVNCPRRAHPPLRRRLFVDESRRGVAAFAFRTD